MAFTAFDSWQQNARWARMNADADRATAFVLQEQGDPLTASLHLTSAHEAEQRALDYEQRAYASLERAA